jgi:DNA modification methylase
MSDRLTILTGDARGRLLELPESSIQCCVTSPPYWNLRDYGIKGQIGAEQTPEDYVANLVVVFREVRRVLKPDGVLWCNIGDTYAGGGNGGGGSFAKDGIRAAQNGTDKKVAHRKGARGCGNGRKPKDLIGIPWMVAFALRSDGWWLRDDVVWNKPNPMPDSCKDRCTRAHEFVFQLTKSARYYFDAAAIREPAKESTIKEVLEGYNGTAQKDFIGNGVQDASATKKRVTASLRKRLDKQRGHSRRHAGFNARWDALTKEEQQAIGSNKKDVWTIAPTNYKGAHFAVMPTALAKLCILAGSKPGDTILDPFGGSGTTGQVALELGRRAILCELNPEYVPQIQQRCSINLGLL